MLTPTRRFGLPTRWFRFIGTNSKTGVARNAGTAGLGVYFEADHPFGQMLHFVFRVEFDALDQPTACSPEIGDVRFWPTDQLPSPMSDFTERRIRDALRREPVSVARIGTRLWRE